MGRRIFIADLHSDSLLAALDKGRDITLRSDEGHIDIPRLIEGNVAVQLFAAFVAPSYYPDRSFARADALIRSFIDVCDRSDVMKQARSHSDIERITDSNGIAGILSIEGGDALGEDISALEHFYSQGVRALTLTWSYSNQIADGIYEKFPDGSFGNGGLTDFGRDVIAAMKDLGILVDVSHISERSFWDVIAVSDGPVIATHSCAHTLCAHPRNLKDEQIRAIAESGGVIGVNFCPDFLSNDGRATVDDVIAHIDHIAKVGGAGCVSLGSDFDGIEHTPEGLEDATKMKNIAVRLEAHGYRNSEIEGMMGMNFLRVFKDVCG
jgi:membrane dipeptidase